MQSWKIYPLPAGQPLLRSFEAQPAFLKYERLTPEKISLFFRCSCRRTALLKGLNADERDSHCGERLYRAC